MKIIRLFILFLLLIASAFSKETLSVVVEPSSSPFTYRSFDGTPKGLFVDFWKLWSKKSGYGIDFKFYNHQSGIEAVKDGNVIFHSGLVPDRKWMVKSDLFYELKTSSSTWVFRKIKSY